MSRILLTGASGRVGIQVIPQLLAAGHQPVVLDQLTRRARRRLRPYRQRIELHDVDLTRSAGLAKKCAGVDAAIHLAGIIPPLAEDDKALATAVNVDGTRHLTEALRNASPEAFLLYSSSIGVYADRTDDPYIRVGDPVRANPAEDHYTETKIAAEEIIRASGLDFSIFRLCGIMGEHEMSRLMFSMPLSQIMEIATAADAARAFVNALEHRAALVGRTFNLGGGEQMRISFGDFLLRSFSIAGLGRVDFPEHAFAEQNFHGGYYTDGDDLENILTFRRDTLDSYFAAYSKTIPGIQRKVTELFASLIKRQLLKMSVPYKAVQERNEDLVRLYFKPATAAKILDSHG